ncbi:MAG: peptidylprolyl isomerase [Cyanobacteria bacterium]|nr:peptidylprolyl isomerase [Cyanobacteria bacterium bin.51]
MKRNRLGLKQCWLALGSALLVALAANLCLVPPAAAGLPPGNAVSDPAALLRDALPIPASDLKDLQHRLEATSDDLRAKRWSALNNSVRRGQSMLSGRRAKLISSFPAAEQAKAATLLDQLELDWRQLAETTEARDRDAFLASRRAALSTIGSAEALLVGPFPFEIPETFADLPRLLGRATIELTTTKGTLTTVVDGYNAPLTAGAFVDLVQRGFYDGLPFGRAEDFYVLQTGDPVGPADGYIDPTSQQQRRVPLEIRVAGEDQPLYNQTFEDLGLFKTTPVLPFATKGTMGWAHSDEALDDGSSQFFLFLFTAELTPAGLNLIDGRYAAFGYVVDGFEVLEELTGSDGIVKATVLEGAENLRPHG